MIDRSRSQKSLVTGNVKRVLKLISFIIEIMENDRGSSKVYLIYSEKSPEEEKRFAEETLRAKLEGRGLAVRSEADFRAGTNLVRGRSGAVQQCSKALIILTENSHNSSWCTLELLLALEKSYRLNTVSLVVLKISGSEKWTFQLVKTLK